MNLQIRNPKAHELAQQLAARRKTSITDAVIGALEAELERAKGEKPLRERARPIIERMLREAKPGGRDLTKEEIDRMWGHE